MFTCKHSKQSEKWLSGIGLPVFKDMAYVDSTSTRAEVQAALVDNASWQVDQSLEKARNYAVAAGVWMMKFAFDRTVGGPAELEMVKANAAIQKLGEQAAAFVTSQSSVSIPAGAGGIVRCSVENFRR